MRVCVTGLDVNGIQRYIGASGKLREMVGASWLVDYFTGARPESILAENLGLKSLSPDSLSSAQDWYVIVRSAGGVVRLLLPSVEIGRAWARLITTEILLKAPGLDVTVSHEEFDWESGNLDEALQILLARLEAKRNRPRSGAAFPGLPFSAPCLLTGDPAAGYGEKDNERLSAACLAKRAVVNEANASLQQGVIQELLKREEIFELLQRRSAGDIVFSLDFTELCQGQTSSRGGGLMAIACFDGNRLGQHIRSLLLPCKSNGERAKAYRNFSINMNAATQAALVDALARILPRLERRIKIEQGKLVLPLRPLVQGGDDVTVVLPGDVGLVFAEAFCLAFEKQTRLVLGTQLHLGAGVAFVKPRSPFLRGYELAESLLSHAKRKDRDSSCIDFEVVRNDSYTDISELRERHYTSGDGSTLTRRPYQVNAVGDFLAKVISLKERMPRSQLKRASDAARTSSASAEEVYRDVCENLKRGLGGGKNPLSLAEFKKLYPAGFFQGSDRSTDLADCIDVFDLVDSSHSNRAWE